MIWALGLFALLYIIREPVMVIYRLYRAPKDLNKSGEWAVVTGATDGIGLAMAKELASRGLNILLISRTESKLIEQKKIIEDQYKQSGVEVDYLAIDYSDFSDARQAQVSDKVQELESKGGVAVLVNNVGMSYSHPMWFHELSSEDVAGLVALNVTSTSAMTHLVLPGMLNRKKGHVVNISSGAAMQPSPLLAQYCGVKAYVNALGVSLDMEYHKKGVRFQTQVPLFVTTKLAKIDRKYASVTKPIPEVYAKAAVNAIGYESLVSPYWAHALSLWALSLLPNLLVEYIMMSMHSSIRTRALKKAAKNKAQ